MKNQFEVGKAYYAFPDIPEKGREIAVVLGMEGRSIQLAIISEIAVGKIETMNFGRPFAKLNTSRGFYGISPVSEVSVADYAEVKEILERARN